MPLDWHTHVVMARWMVSMWMAREVLDGEHVDGEVLVVVFFSFGRRLVVLLISLHILPWRCTCI